MHLERERAMSLGTGAPTDGSDTGIPRPPLTWRAGSLSGADGTLRSSPFAVVYVEERRG